MGGNSTANTNTTTDGLSLEGLVIEKNGGFISCKSPLITPPLDLSSFKGIEIIVYGQGKNLKLAISCLGNRGGIADFFSRGLRWIVEFQTNETGSTHIKIPFTTLEPNIRAKRVPLPLSFNKASINQFQLLYSKFGISGKLNTKFIPGPIKILLTSIVAYT